MISDEAVPVIRRRLLSWYHAHRRDLPWRRSVAEAVDPYRIWLSEVMLQQTRVDTVVPYYARWLARFPTLEALAAASADEVMKAWEGLGYYSRARNLHRAAQQVAERHAGRVPDDPEVFRKLPGVGRYTAGAVLSIAFEREEPVVDGNIRRVFSRWTAIGTPSEQALWSLARRMVDGAQRPGDLNQAMMELGATVCTPRDPRCSDCPVRDFCAAHDAGTQEHCPLTRPAKPVPHERQAVAVVRKEGTVLLARRLARGRLGGLWEFPSLKMDAAEDVFPAAERAVLAGLGLEAHSIGLLGVVRHRFTHVRVSYEAVRCEYVAGEATEISYDRHAWVRPGELEAYPLPVAQRKIVGLAVP